MRNTFELVNLIPVFRKALPNLKCHKLACLEKHFDIERTTEKYKTNVFNLFSDWKYNRADVLKYNMEDVINLLKLTQIIDARLFKGHNRE